VRIPQATTEAAILPAEDVVDSTIAVIQEETVPTESRDIVVANSVLQATQIEGRVGGLLLVAMEERLMEHINQKIMEMQDRITELILANRTPVADPSAIVPAPPVADVHKPN
jgi:hypothetical protein